jgi:NAD(P)-dependent dehydrogenase (short-subunit alcohol dehydrogenase family)
MTTSSSLHDEFAGVPVALLGGHLGVGPAIVRAFADRGARVVIGEIAHAPSTAAQRDACAGAGAKVLPVDLADAASIETFLDACERDAGPLAVLVLVPPPVKVKDALAIPLAEYRRVLDEELAGPMAAMLAAARRMGARGHGRIVSLCSMSGKTGTHKQVAPYAAAKGGLVAFTRALATDLASTGVTVNAIATALFDVQVAALDDAHRAEVEKGIPVGRVGRSEEAAHAVLYLASRNGGYVTGETLNLSGGRFMD